MQAIPSPAISSVVSPTTEENMNLSFVWKGKNCEGAEIKYEEGQLWIGAVDLIFKNCFSEISVNIPKDISPDGEHKLPFTVREYDKIDEATQLPLLRQYMPGKALKSEGKCAGLNVTVDMVKTLVIKAGIFEISPNRGCGVVDAETGIVTYQKRFIRSDQEVKFELPETLEPKQNYRIVFTVIGDNMVAPIARLVKESPTEKKKLVPSTQGQQLIYKAYQNDKEFLQHNINTSIRRIDEIPTDLIKTFGNDVHF